MSHFVSQTYCKSPIYSGIKLLLINYKKKPGKRGSRLLIVNLKKDVTIYTQILAQYTYIKVNVLRGHLVTNSLMEMRMRISIVQLWWLMKKKRS